MRSSDWSSDVCSSDLSDRCRYPTRHRRIGTSVAKPPAPDPANRLPLLLWRGVRSLHKAEFQSSHRLFLSQSADRSEERRGGEAWVCTCSSRWSPYHSTQHNKTINRTIV